jgi:hypothetical protein
LLVDEQLGITHDVDKENVPDFELHIGFGRHTLCLPRSSESDEIGGRKTENRHGRLITNRDLRLIFWCEIGDNLFEARITAQRVPNLIELE